MLLISTAFAACNIFDRDSAASGARKGGELLEVGGLRHRYECQAASRARICALLYTNFAENCALWGRDRTPRALGKQHRTHKGGSEFFASVARQLFTTQTELLIWTGGI